MDVRKDYEKLFKNLYSLEPPERLYQAILARIEVEKIRAARIRVGLLGFVALISVVAVVPIFQYIVREFAQSGFYQYASLLISDSGVLIAHWKEFMLSLVESTPILGATIFLSIIFVLLSSLRLAIKNIRIAFLSSQLI